MRINVRVVWIGALALAGIAGLATAQEERGGRSRYPQRREAQTEAGAIRATFTVAPGQTIQAAVDRARPGGVVEILPGVYQEEVVVDFDDIEVRGVTRDGERPLLDGKGALNDAIMVAGNNFRVSGLEIRNYKGNGIVVNQAKDCQFRDIVAHNTGKYALYPVLCDGVRIEDCVASGVWDAAIYAGQCRNVVIQNCEAFQSTIGIETENCVNVLIANNSAYNNSLGILVVLLPDLPTTLASNARVINNRVFDNNYPNLSPPGNLVNLVEPGVGIAVSAADQTEVTRNRVEGNLSFGIALYSLVDSMPDRKEFNVEPHPDGNHIHHNEFSRNGGSLNKRFKNFGVTGDGGDLFWSGKGTANGWDEATDKTFPASLPRWTGGLAGGGSGGR